MGWELGEQMERLGLGMVGFSGVDCDHRIYIEKDGKFSENVGIL